MFLPHNVKCNPAQLEETRFVLLYALLIAARAGIVRHRGISYALTWVDYD